jgi:hypothetical protein
MEQRLLYQPVISSLTKEAASHLHSAKELNRDGRDDPQRKKIGRASIGKVAATGQTEITGNFYF